MQLFIWTPESFGSFNLGSLVEISEQSREWKRRFPAMGLAGGEGKVGENGEGLESYPWVVVGGAEVVGAGLSTARGGRRRDWAAAVLLR